MKRKGSARGAFRMDESRRWNIDDKLNKPNAPAARRRMAEGAHSLTEVVAQQQMSLTDQVVNEFMGGSNAAANQARAYGEVMDNFKYGRGAKEPTGSLAEAARRHMIEREEKKQDPDETPDIGRDKARRRAYPAGSGKDVK